MSAGIVSACLPILGPVMAFCAAKLSIKRSLLMTRGGGTTNTSSSKNFAQSATGSTRDRTEIELQKARKSSAGPVFYLLRDDQMLGDTARAVDAELRAGAWVWVYRDKTAGEERRGEFERGRGAVAWDSDAH